MHVAMVRGVACGRTLRVEMVNLVLEHFIRLGVREETMKDTGDGTRAGL